MREKYTKTVEIEGYRTGNHDAGCIAEEPGTYYELRSDGDAVFIEDLYPEEVARENGPRDERTKFKFEITVEATPVENGDE